LLERTTPFEDAEVVALCDVYRPTIEEWAAKVPNKVTLYGDYREMLENEELDAVVIATPDHWHALQTIDACKAGLDVYVEKPLSITIRRPAHGRGGARDRPHCAGGDSSAVVRHARQSAGLRASREDRSGGGGAVLPRQQHVARWYWKYTGF
jgi:hypothetical protein